MSHSDSKLQPDGSETVTLRSAIQDLQARTVRERDAERSAIARELHDKFGQYLTVMDMELAAILDYFDLPADVTERLVRVRGLTEQARQDMAHIAWQMRPATLHNMDLKAACELLISEWSSRSNLSFDLHVSLGRQRLTEQMETTLYRIVQEAVTNAARHSNASKIGIVLRIGPSEVVLIVEDNGDGFRCDTEEIGSPLSLGLLGIRERLALVGGNLEIESSPHQGTTLLISVPL